MVDVIIYANLISSLVYHRIISRSSYTYISNVYVIQDYLILPVILYVIMHILK